MTLFLDEDDNRFLYTVPEESMGPATVRVEVSEEVAKRWNSVEKAFWDMQCELSELFEAECERRRNASPSRPRILWDRGNPTDF